MGRGRPSLYKPEYCDRVIEMGAMGKSRVQMAANLGVSRNTLDTWVAQHEDFLEAMTRADTLAQDWWEQAGQDGVFLDGRRVDTALWKVVMQARFRNDYTERTIVEGNPDAPLTIRIRDLTVGDGDDSNGKGE